MVRSRQARRLRSEIPLKINVENSLGCAEVSVLTENISSRGVYFRSIFPFEVRQKLIIALTPPIAITGTMRLSRIYHGIVTRTEADELRGMLGVAVEFLYYETLKERPAGLKAVDPRVDAKPVVRKRLARMTWREAAWDEKKTA